MIARLVVLLREFAPQVIPVLRRVLPKAVLYVAAAKELLETVVLPALERALALLREALLALGA